MRVNNFSLVLISSLCLAATLSAAPMIQFTDTMLPGSGHFRYNYTVSGVTFQMGQDFDVQFNPALYSNLTNGVAGPGFTAVVLDVNNPPGVHGDYIAVANVNNPPLTGPFSVDFTYLGAGLPGSQPFTIDTFDANGNLINSIAGTTTPAGTGGGTVPEPSGFVLSFIGLLVCAGLAAVRHRSNIQVL